MKHSRLFKRREILRKLGVSAASTPFLAGLPSLMSAAEGKSTGPSVKKRLVIMFSPNGTIPHAFWPDKEGPAFTPNRILKPLEKYRDRMLVLNGVSNKVRGDGDNHMRGMSCLLTGRELLPGNIQGGSNTPAGWASGISIDQELRNHFQKNPASQTRFGSLEFGVAVPNRADPWTRMSYAGAGQPMAPISDPGRMLEKLYGKQKDKGNLKRIVDDLRDDFKKVAGKIAPEDRELLEKHIHLVAGLEEELSRPEDTSARLFPVPDIDPTIELVNDNTPRISRNQIDLLVNAMANDMTRIATLQFMRSVGQARMHWLGIDEGHHGLSHEPDGNAVAVEKLVKINEWFCGELAYLTGKLAATPEPGDHGGSSMLDHTLIIWLNELGKGNSHTLDHIPSVMIGGEKATGFKMGRYINHKDPVAHNRLWLAVGKAMGHPMKAFGTEKYCQGGALIFG